MDINDLKIGIEGTFVPPFKAGIASIKEFELIITLTVTPYIS